MTLAELQNSCAPITFSFYQANILEWVRQGRGSAVVIAVAGAGKTFVIENSLPLIPESAYVTLLAFNKSIADELNRRIDALRVKYKRPFARVMARTFHSLGVSAVAKKLGVPVRGLKIDAGKMRDICRSYMTEIEYNMYGDFVTQLVGFAKGIGVGALVPDTQSVWWEIIRYHDIFLDSEDATEDRAIALAHDMLERSNKISLEQKYIDFDDQLYLPLLWRLRLWQNDWLMVDEAQDTNPVRRALAKMSLRPGGRSMWVGDPCQSIYGFTGASHDAIDIIKDEFNATELPLSVSYRCSKAVVADARKIVSHILPSESAPEGAVHVMPCADALDVLGPDDAVLCRQVAPLISLAMHLIANGRPCAVAGREIGQGLVSLIKRMKAKDIDSLEAKLKDYAEREVTKFMGRGEESKAEAVSDRVACIRAMIEQIPEDERTVYSLICRVEGLFAEGQKVLTLYSVHKAKGREFVRVGILQPELMPSKWARQAWQAQQEQNVMYVARTRAKLETYYMVGDFKARSSKPLADHSLAFTDPAAYNQFI